MEHLYASVKCTPLNKQQFASHISYNSLKYTSQYNDSLRRNEAKDVQTSLGHEKQKKNTATSGAKAYFLIPLETWEYRSQESRKTFPRTTRDLGVMRSRKQSKAIPPAFGSSGLRDGFHSRGVQSFIGFPDSSLSLTLSSHSYSQLSLSPCIFIHIFIFVSSTSQFSVSRSPFLIHFTAHPSTNHPPPPPTSTATTNKYFSSSCHNSLLFYYSCSQSYPPTLLFLPPTAAAPSPPSSSRLLKLPLSSDKLPLPRWPSVAPISTLPSLPSVPSNPVL